MKNKKVQTEINKLVEQSFKGGKSDNAFIAKVTASLKKLTVIESTNALTLYLKGLKRKVAENTLVVESAVKLSPSELKSVEKLVKREVFATEQVITPSLLGGLRVKIGDELLDFSLKSKINQVAERIKS